MVTPKRGDMDLMTHLGKESCSNANAVCMYLCQYEAVQIETFVEYDRAGCKKAFGEAFSVAP